MEDGSGDLPDGGTWLSAPMVRKAVRLLDSHRHWLGRELVPRGDTAVEDARFLRESPIVVVAHGTEDDPLLNYANRRALQLWACALDDLLGLPSRFTAEPVEREEREAMLRRTAAFGFVDDYGGVRISRTGQRFLIRKATVWNVLDEEGGPAGQAAAFADWEWLEAPASGPTTNPASPAPGVR